MIIPPEAFEEARENALKELEFLSPDEQWELLRREIKKERDDQVARMLSMLRLAAIREIVAPHTKRETWNKGLNPATDLDRWIHNQRLWDATM